MAVSRTYVSRETARRIRRSNLETGEQLRRMRQETGISLSELSRIVGVHRSHIARIEVGAAQGSLEVLTAIGVALGADLSLRYFPGAGPRLHDRFQAAMVEAFLRELDPRWGVELEVPITQPSRGVIDLVLTERAAETTVASEAQSQLRRLEQQIRWSTEKAEGLAQRLERPVSRLLILRSTVATRELARTHAATLATAYPARTEAVIRALTTATAPWPGHGIVWMHVVGTNASLMEFPPRGVSLGR